MNKKYYWLKLKNDFFTSRPMKKLRKIAGGDTYTIIYLKLQLLSLQNNGKLFYEGVEESLLEELALDIDEDIENIKATIFFLERCGLVTDVSPDSLSLPEVEDNTGKEGSSAKRVRDYRERQKQKTLPCNTDVTKCNTEIEKDIELEKELKIELEKKKEKSKNKKKFSPPTLEEVKAHMKEKIPTNNGFEEDEAIKFISYYESNGWRVGKNKMANWKSACTGWLNRMKNFDRGSKPTNQYQEPSTPKRRYLSAR